MFNYLTLFTALAISSVAIYYSVAGLVAIFAAYAVAITIMGVALEIGKLVSVVYLHRNWDTAVWWLKHGLTGMTAVLMVITSMGIFGFLSKSHIEQTAASGESVAQVQRITTEIARNESIVARAEGKIRKAEDGGSNVDISIQKQIDKEQERIALTYKRMEQTELLTDKRVKPYLELADSITVTLENLQQAINKGDIRKAQAIVGTQLDGNYGPDTAQKIKTYRGEEGEKRARALAKVNEIRSAKTAGDKEIADSNALIFRLREKLGTSGETDVESLIVTQQTKIKAANGELDKLFEEKFVLQTQTRKLEAEVGPIRYIAAFVYGGEPGPDVLEKAVTWVIILLIIVFDPLAVLLLIASQYAFDKTRGDKKMKEMIHDEVVEEVDHVMHEVFDEPEPEPKPEEVVDITTDFLNDLLDEAEIGPVTQKVEPELEATVTDNRRTVWPDTRVHSTNFIDPVASGTEFPEYEILGTVFIRTDSLPTKVYQNNGKGWISVDKNLLEYTAYSEEYIATLIDLVGSGAYTPELLNDNERKHIEATLG